MYPRDVRRRLADLGHEGGQFGVEPIQSLVRGGTLARREDGEAQEAPRKAAHARVRDSRKCENKDWNWLLTAEIQAQATPLASNSALDLK